jgi:hypothetical protein
MRCDFWASFLAHNLASPCLGHKPKVKVATMNMLQIMLGARHFEDEKKQDETF